MLNQKAGWSVSLLILALTFASTTRAANPLPLPSFNIIAHRGASGLAPEETRPSYMLARDLGADYLEMDLHRTQDGAIILNHDNDLLRTTDAAAKFPGRASYLIKDWILADIQKLDLGKKFNASTPAFARAGFVAGDDPNEPADKAKVLAPRILTLEQLIEIAEEPGTNRPGLYIEFKSPDLYPGIEAQVIAILRAHGWLAASPNQPLPEQSALGNPEVTVGQTRQRLVFQSFDTNCLKRLSSSALGLRPEVPLVLLTDTNKFPDGKDAIQEAIAVGATGIGPIATLFGLNLVKLGLFVNRAHAQNLFVHPYYFDPALQMRLFKGLDDKTQWFNHHRDTMKMADGFFTNRADIALEQIRGKSGMTDKAKKMLTDYGYAL